MDSVIEVSDFKMFWDLLSADVRDYLMKIHAYFRLNAMEVLVQSVALLMLLVVVALFCMLMMCMLKFSFRIVIKVLKYFYSVFSIWRAGRYVTDLEPIDSKIPSTNTILYRTIETGEIRDVNGVLFEVVNVPKNMVGKQPEMALANSTFVTENDKITRMSGLMAIRNDSGQVIGMASCIGFQQHGPTLLTASHVWREVVKAGAGRLEHKGKTFSVNLRWKTLLYSPECDLDLCVIAVPHEVFASISVKKLPTAKLFDRSRCTLYGYDRSGNFGYSMGAANHTPGEAFRLIHHGSTISGFSGTPVMHLGKVVGIHTGANNLKQWNEGSTLFWLQMSSIESDKTDGDPIEFVLELPQGKSRNFQWRTMDTMYDVSQVGRSVKVAPREEKVFEYDWSDHLMEPMDFSVPFSFESMDHLVKAPDFPSGKVVSPVQQPPPPLPAPHATTVLSPPTGKDLPGSSALEGTKSSKKRKRQKKKVSDSKKSENAPVVPMEQLEGRILEFMRKLANGEKVLHSGASRREMPQPNEGASSSRGVDTTVQVCVMSRKEEKLYNRICHHRKFQQALRSRTPEEAMCLRKATLDFVIFSKTVSTEKQVQDFLSSL